MGSAAEWRLLTKLNTELMSDPATPSLGMRQTETDKHVCEYAQQYGPQ